MDNFLVDNVFNFKQSLNNLQFSKTEIANQQDHLISELKSIAFEDLWRKDEIVEAIRAQFDRVDLKSKMLFIKLIHAIVSTINKNGFKGFFDEYIVDIVYSVYANGDEMTKAELFDMREKWTPYFSKNILIRLDNTIRNVDKKWLNFPEKPEQLALHKEKQASLNEIERLKKERDLARAMKLLTNVVIPTPQANINIINSIPNGISTNKTLPAIQERPQVPEKHSEAKALHQPINRPSANESMPGPGKRSHVTVNPQRYRPKEMNFVTEASMDDVMKRPHAAAKASITTTFQVVSRKSPVNEISNEVKNQPEDTTSERLPEISEEMHLKRKRDYEKRRQWELQQEEDISDVHFEPLRKIHCFPNNVRNSNDTSGSGVWELWEIE